MLPAMEMGSWSWTCLSQGGHPTQREGRACCQPVDGSAIVPAAAAVIPKGWSGSPGASRTVVLPSWLQPQLPAVLLVAHPSLLQAAVMVAQAGMWQRQAGQPWHLSVTLCSPPGEQGPHQDSHHRCQRHGQRRSSPWGSGSGI